MKNCLLTLSTTLAGFLFFSNFSSVVAMNSKSKKSFNSSEYSGSLEEKVDIASYRINLYEKKFKCIEPKGHLHELVECIRVPIAYKTNREKFIEDLILYGLTKNESVVKNSVLHLRENLDCAKLILSKNNNIYIYALDVADDDSLLDICLIVELLPNSSFELYPGLGKVDKAKFIDIVNSNKKNLIDSLQRHFGLIDISSDEELGEIHESKEK